MSAPLNVGEIDFNKPLTKEATEIIKEILGLNIEAEATYIFVDDYYSYDLEDELQKLCEKLAPLGYLASGHISYYDDYICGRIDVEGDVVFYLSAEESAVQQANDQTLIEELEARGYTVAKKGGD